MLTLHLSFRQRQELPSIHLLLLSSQTVLESYLPRPKTACLTVTMSMRTKRDRGTTVAVESVQRRKI